MGSLESLMTFSESLWIRIHHGDLFWFGIPSLRNPPLRRNAKVLRIKAELHLLTLAPCPGTRDGHLLPEMTWGWRTNGKMGWPHYTKIINKNIYIIIYIYTFKYAYIYLYIYTKTYIYILKKHKNKYIYIYKYKKHIKYKYIYIYTYIYTNINKQIYKYIHRCIYRNTYTYTSMYIYIRIYIYT
jgi:hypothetical protein